MRQAAHTCKMRGIALMPHAKLHLTQTSHLGLAGLTGESWYGPKSIAQLPPLTGQQEQQQVLQSLKSGEYGRLREMR